jgi:hypothetical protein
MMKMGSNPCALRLQLSSTKWPLILFVAASSLCAAQPDASPEPQSQTSAPATPPAGTQANRSTLIPVPPIQQPTDRTTLGKTKSTTGTSKDRLFYTLPNFLTLETADQVPPLTTSEKFKVTAQSSFDPVEYFWYGALAGISQAQGSEAGFGQGGKAYGERYGAYFADGTIENFLSAAVFPSLLHQDPRYFQLGQGGFWHRAGYAISHTFVTRDDRGRNQFNWSEILGSALAAGISTYAYHPVGDRNIPNTGSVWGSELGYDTMTWVIKEFWPDIRRKLHHSKSDLE